MSVLTLDNGYYDLPPGKLLNVVICLEMRARPVAIGPGLSPAYQLKRLGAQDLDTHRAIFRAVGADLLWFSRLIMPDAQLQAILANPDVESFAVMKDGQAVGILELNFATQPECELAFFGVVQDMVGTGLGKALMNEALARAWARPIQRLWVHTCHYDHPRALGFYQRSGFRAYARMIEIHDDPRSAGFLPSGVALHVPMLEHS